MAWSIDRVDATELAPLVLKGFPYLIAAVDIHRREITPSADLYARAQAA
ncbi:hypothetical protein [Nitrobacter vulgaris]|nr:hypothetical protein [Nitrobacter vulgaris]